jgi:hypothetical protein
MSGTVRALPATARMTSRKLVFAAGPVAYGVAQRRGFRGSSALDDLANGQSRSRKDGGGEQFGIQQPRDCKEGIKC